MRVADTRAEPPFATTAATLPACRVVTGAVRRRDVRGRDMIAISPGVAKDQPPIAAAVARGVELVGDIELFARALPPGAEGARDHRHQRQDHGDRADGRAVPRRRARHASSRATSATPVLDVLAADDRGARAGPTCSCSSCRASSSRRRRRCEPVAAAVLNVTDNHLDRYARHRRLRRGQGAHLRRRRRAGAQPRRSAHRWRCASPAAPSRSFGAGVPAREGEWGLVAASIARRGSRTAAACSLPTELARSSAGTTRSTRSRRSRSRRRVGRVDRRVLDALRSFRRACRIACERVAEAGGVALHRRFEGHDGRRDAGGARGHRAAASC